MEATSLKCAAQFIAAAMVVSFSGTASADEFYQHAVMNCAHKTVWAEITTHGTYNDDPAPTGVVECMLPNFGSVKLKVGAGPVYAYGQGYGEPTMFISLWVRQAKVLSRETFKCEWAGACELRVSVTLGGLRVCRKKQEPPNRSGHSSGLRSENCKLTMWDELPNERDQLEYPTPGEKVRPADGSIAMILARDEQFCGSLLPIASGDSIQAPPEGGPIQVIRSGYDAEVTSHWEYAGYYSYYDLDVDNDGRVDRIVHLHAQTHAFDGDELFVFSSASVPDLRIGKLEETRSQDEYATAANFVLPDAWPSEVLSIPPPWWNPEDELRSGRLSRGYLQPIRANGKTYLIATTSASKDRHWTIVLEPHPDRSVETKCAFQRVQPNF